MYPTIHNKNGSLKHSTECKMAFGRKDSECPRCVELLSGAETRGGWQKDHFEMKKHAEMIEDEARMAHFKSHKHLSGACGSVCTFGEW